MHVLWALLVAAQTSVSRAPLPSPAPDTAHFVSRQDSTVLRVLALNDFHGALEARSWPWSHGRAVGGAAALKPWLDSLARACGCTTIRLDAGDEMQGTLLSNFGFGLPAITAMNAFGIDAAAIGNHEFDWSVDTLRARMAGARYRFLAANISDTTGTARPGWAAPGSRSWSSGGCGERYARSAPASRRPIPSRSVPMPRSATRYASTNEPSRPSGAVRWHASRWSCAAPARSTASAA